MAGLGEAAGVAGLIGLAGQCLEQLSKLHAFTKAFQNAAPEAMKITDELMLLRQCLNQVHGLASRAVSLEPDLPDSIRALSAAVSKCHKAILDIEQKIRSIHPGEKRVAWSKFKVAMSKDYYTRLYNQLSHEKQDLMLRLDAFSW